MSEPIRWQELTTEQRNALIAEEVFGWQWMPGDQYGPHVKKDTNWLLPENGLSGIKSDLSADWISIEENRFVPRNWIPRYTQSMDAAWLVLKQMCHEAEWTEQMMLFINYLDGEYEVVDKNATRLEPIYTLTQLALLTPEKICFAALRAVGVELTDG